MADITYKGLTGLLGTVTVDLATDTFDTLIAAIASDEGLPTDYYHIALERDPSKNDRDFADSSTPLTLDDVDIAMVDGDTVICTPNQNSLTKQERQVMKLEIAQLKRQGGSAGDTSARYYRPNNTYDLTSLPDTYNGNVPGPDDNPNTEGLLPKRPWVAVSAEAAPTSIGESVGGDTFLDLEIWYDGSDQTTIIPSGTGDEGPINQWNDKSGLAHNLNFSGGNNKPTYETSDLKNGHEYVQFEDGDLMSINPLATLSGAQEYTVFVIAQSTDLTTNATQILTSTDNDELSIQIDTDGTARFKMGASNSVTTASGTVGLNEWNIYTLVYDGGNNIVGRVFNGTPPAVAAGAGAGPAAMGSSTYLYVGGNSSGGTFIGHVGEVILFKKALSSVEYQNVENYLKTKWGL